MATLPREPELPGIASADPAIIGHPADVPAWTIHKALAELPVQPAESTESPVPFFHLLERLKTTKRKGWMNHGIMQSVTSFLCYE